MGRSYKRSVCRSEKPEADGSTPSRPTSAALDELDKLPPSQGGDCGSKSRTRYIIFLRKRRCSAESVSFAFSRRSPMKTNKPSDKTQYDKIREITEKLEAGIRDLFDSENYKNWLRTMSRFHNYSVNNTILIHLQKPDATLVASYLSWQRNFDRQVNKGERAIQIIAPAPIRKKIETDRLDPSTGAAVLNADGTAAKDIKEILIPNYKVVSVFDVSQTEGKALPTLGVEELDGSVKGYSDFIEALRRTCPVSISFENIRGSAKGYFHTVENRIAIREGMSEAQTMKTMLHEMAHQKLHSLDPKRDEPEEKMTRSRKEIEAESVAFIVSCHYGIDTSDYSFGYIAGWSEGKDNKEFKESLTRIQHAADEMITDIDEQLEEIREARLPNRSVIQDLKEKKEISALMNQPRSPQEKKQTQEAVR